MVIRIPDQRTARGGYAALDDRMLVLDFQAGHPEAFVEIHRRYGGLARHVCQRFLPNQADVDEALQETLIRVFQGLYRFNGRYALRPWIARIAKNVSLDILRARARRPLEGDAPLDEEFADPNDEADLIVERLVQRDTVLEILTDLPETHRRALVLREIDGRSHREIAHEMEITPSQAKALIHRARGSFRKGWLEKVTGEGGVRAIAFLPVLWLAQAAGLVRRAGERVGLSVGHATQAAQVATSEAITSTVSSAAPAGASLSERVIAAGMTLLVAGGVTVGAAKVVQNRMRPEPAGVAAAAAAAADVSNAVAPEPAPQVGEPPLQSPRPVRDETEIAPIAVEPLPTIEPSPSVEPTVDPSPSVEPTVDPSPSVEPPIAVFPPAPAWSGGFAIDWTSEDECGCGPGVALSASQSSGGLLEEGAVLTAIQQIRGAADDAEGDPAWALEADYAVELTQAGGSLQLSFTLEHEGFRTSFSGSASVTEVTGTPGDGEPMVYTLSGSYGLSGGSGDKSPIRTSGGLSIRLSLWADGLTVYGTQFQLRP
jgi:RNA polymerase sigma-70 factor (ECF subfamily)